MYKTRFLSLLKKPTFYFFVLVILFSLTKHKDLTVSSNEEGNGPFEYDVEQYYSFLPKIFYETSDSVTENFTTNKRTIGMAVMYLPAFVSGHVIASITGAEKTGVSIPYRKTIRWLSILYVIAGLLFCRKSMLLFFNEFIVAASLTCVFFGTNLFFYTYCQGEMPHGYLFFLYSAFIYTTIQFIHREKSSALLWIGLTAGMITLIRPTDVIIILFPLMYKIHSLTDLKNRLFSFFKKPFQAITALMLFLAPFVLQMCVWKKYCGEFIHYSYTDERFFFNDPQISNFLISYKKGWLLYTPIMIFSLIGIVLSKKYMKDMFLFLLVFNVLNVYILSCWFDWAFGGSFGCRVLVQSYSVLLFPFALFLSWSWNVFKSPADLTWVSRIFISLILVMLLRFNLYQNDQYRRCQIHWDGMNEKMYKFVFLRNDLSPEEFQWLMSQSTPLDYVKLKRGERELPESR